MAMPSPPSNVIENVKVTGMAAGHLLVLSPADPSKPMYIKNVHVAVEKSKADPDTRPARRLHPGMKRPCPGQMDRAEGTKNDVQEQSTTDHHRQ